MKIAAVSSAEEIRKVWSNKFPVVAGKLANRRNVVEALWQHWRRETSAWILVMLLAGAKARFLGAWYFGRCAWSVLCLVVPMGEVFGGVALWCTASFLSSGPLMVSALHHGAAFAKAVDYMFAGAQLEHFQSFVLLDCVVGDVNAGLHDARMGGTQICRAEMVGYVCACCGVLVGASNVAGPAAACWFASALDDVDDLVELGVGNF